MRVSLSVTLLAFLLPIVAHCTTVYIDKTCINKKDWKEYWADAKAFSKRAVERMNSATDRDFNAEFVRIFQTEKSSPNGQFVNAILTDMSKLTKESDLKKAQIRIFCDDDDRWVPRDENKGGGFIDKKNQMIASRLSCKGQASGVNYRSAIPDSPGQHPLRRTISICNIAFSTSGGRVRRLGLLGNIDNKTIKTLGLFTGHILVHELAHALHDAIIDHAYDWERCVSIGPSYAIRNAQNYAYLGVLAVFADWGYTLQRLNERTDAPFIAWAEDRAKNGYIKKYKDITKRKLRAKRIR